MRRGIALAALVMLTLSGCNRYEPISVTAADVRTSEPETQAVQIDETQPEPVEGPEQLRIERDGLIPSYLTGEWIPVETARQRPLAVMISNDKAALPHYGMNRAGVIYEAPVEGSMNRFMALIEDWETLERIGSVRSCRTYYTYFAREFEAVCIHFGQSSFALPFLARIEHINGIEGKGTDAFYRSTDRRRPHNAYTSGELSRRAMEALGYAREYPQDYDGHYRFASQSHPTLLENGFSAAYVRPGYPMNNPWFEFHPEDGLYYRFQYGGPHDGDEGQLTAKNIIFQYCNWKYYSPSEYLDIDVHYPLPGYYFTNGRGELISWEKDGLDAVTKYYDNDGQEILLNPGTTWVCIIQSDLMDKAEFYGEQAQ